MNKFKVVSLLLAVSLLAALVRLVWVSRDTAAEPAADKAETVYQNLLSRKSVRSYTDRPVSREALDSLVRVAMAAPTGRDMRPWSFVVVSSRSVLDSLAAAMPRNKMLGEAQAAIVVCGNLSVTDDQGKPSQNWTLDCAAATENLLLMAEAMGLGAVWTAVYPYDDRLEPVCRVLELPDHLVPLSLVPIGYPKGDPKPKDKYDPDRIIYY